MVHYVYNIQLTLGTAAAGFVAAPFAKESDKMKTLHRIRHLRRLMEETDLDFCLLTSPENMQYFSGFEAITYSRPIFFLVSPDTTTLIIPALEEAHAHLDSTGADRLLVYYEHPEKASLGTSAMELVGKVLPQGKQIALGVEAGALSLRNAAALEALGCTLTDIGPHVVEMRYLKDEEEQGYIREAGRLSVYAFEKTLEHAREGISEMELEQRGTTALFEYLGTDYPYHFSSPGCITPSGPERTVMPHVYSNTRRLQQGDMVIHVRKPAVNGYYGELERTFFIGQPSPETERAFCAMLEAQTAVMEAIRPGVTAGEMDRLGRDILRRYGYGDYAIHRIGHGMGLGRHEEPFLIANSHLVIEPGMVLTIEPGIYIPGLGGFRHSDTVLITPDGRENTTAFPNQLKDLIF